MSKIIGITVGTPLSPRSIKEKLNPVTSVNGIEADEHGNVEIESGGASSWNDLKDKPFGEETVTVNEPLNITWDGNTEGLVSVGGMLFKVSDLVLTNEQIKSATLGIANGPNVVVNDQWDSMVADGSIEEHAVIVNYESMPRVLLIRKAGFELGGMTFNEVGIYFVSASGFYTAFLTTTEPVEQTKTVVKPIDMKYLPDNVGGASSWNDLKDKPFGEETKLVNEPLNITWDGNTEGLVSDAGGLGLYKVSNLILTDAELKLCTYKSSDSTTQHNIGEMWDEGLGTDIIATEDFTMAGMICCVRTDGFAFSPAPGIDIVFPEAGIYFMKKSNFHVEYLTTTEPVEQTKTVVKTLDEKYLPTLTSPSGKKFKLSVDDSGVLSATEV